MSNQPTQVPLIEMLRRIPKDLRVEWPSQWAEDGREIGYTMAPVGLDCHNAADYIEHLEKRDAAHTAAQKLLANRIKELEAKDELSK